MEIEYYGTANIRKEEINRGRHENEKHFFLDINLVVLSLSSKAYHNINKISFPLNSYTYNKLLKQLEESSSDRFVIKRGNLELCQRT